MAQRPRTPGHLRARALDVSSVGQLLSVDAFCPEALDATKPLRSPTFPLLPRLFPFRRLLPPGRISAPSRPILSAMSWILFVRHGYLAATGTRTSPASLLDQQPRRLHAAPSCSLVNSPLSSLLALFLSHPRPYFPSSLLTHLSTSCRMLGHVRRWPYPRTACVCSAMSPEQPLSQRRGLVVMSVIQNKLRQFGLLHRTPRWHEHHSSGSCQLAPSAVTQPPSSRRPSPESPCIVYHASCTTPACPRAFSNHENPGFLQAHGGKCRRVASLPPRPAGEFWTGRPLPLPGGMRDLQVPDLRCRQHRRPKSRWPVPGRLTPGNGQYVASTYSIQSPTKSLPI